MNQENEPTHIMRLNHLTSFQAIRLAFAAALLPGLALAGPFRNGSFENGLNPPTSSYRSLFGGNSDIDGWVVVSGRIDWCGTPCLPKVGLMSAQLVGNGSAISQTFDTAIGASYIVSFSLQPGGAVTAPVTIDVTMGGSTFHAVIPTGPCCTWYDYSTTLPASSTSSTLEFSSVDAGSVGPFIDDVKVIAASPPTNSPPTIFTQPRSRTNTVGSTVAFSVVAGGTAPLNYQWLSNSLPLTDGGRVTGANSNQLTIASLQLSDSGGNYSVIVSNDFGSALSSNAVLVVTTNITWTGAVSSDWNNPANWNPQQVPAANNRVIINSGNVTIPADGTFAIMDWSGGSISGSLTVASNAVLNLTGSGAKNIVVLTNAGTVVWTGSGVLYAGNNGSPYDARIENLAGGLWDIQSDDSTLNPWFNGGSQYFRNAGTVRKSASTGTTSLLIPFYNTGTVTVLQGTLDFQNGGTLEGTYSAAAGTAIDFSGGAFSYGAAPILKGPGALQFTGNSLTLVTNVIPNLQLVSGTISLGPFFQGGSITNLSLNGPTLTGTNTVSGTFNLGGGGVVGPLTVAGGATVNWSGGIAFGPVTVASNAALNLIGSGAKYIGPLTNAGTVVWSGSGGLYSGYPSSGQFSGSPYNGLIENLANGLWDIQNDSYLNPYFSGGSQYFHNAGRVRKSASTGTTSFGIPFYNTGTIEAQTGTINFEAGYSDSSSANLAISFGGGAPGSGYGKISSSTPLSFDGAFTVSTRNSYLPNPGATFQVLSYPSSTNSFTCLSGLDLGGGILLQPQFSPTGLMLLATAYTTNASQPQLFINRTLGGLAITWPIGFPGWMLQSSTNLSSADWASVPNACENQAIVPVRAPSQFFRLKQ